MDAHVEGADAPIYIAPEAKPCSTGGGFFCYQGGNVQVHYDSIALLLRGTRKELR